jgi:virulence-associated protein VagC
MEVVDPMPETGIAKLFRNGRSQAVRLPREFRFEGNQVRVRRLADGVLLEPLIADPADWFPAKDGSSRQLRGAKSLNELSARYQRMCRPDQQ